MKNRTLLLFAILLLSAATGSPAYAFNLSFAYTLCTLPAAEIEQSVSNFSDKLIRVRRLEARGSAYRKHVERDARELHQALTTAVTASNCSAEQRKTLMPLQQAFEALYLRNKIVDTSP